MAQWSWKCGDRSGHHQLISLPSQTLVRELLSWFILLEAFHPGEFDRTATRGSNPVLLHAQIIINNPPSSQRSPCSGEHCNDHRLLCVSHPQTQTIRQALQAVCSEVFEKA